MSLKKVVISSATGILFLYAMLIASTFYFFDTKELHKAFTDERVLHAIWISVIAACVATIMAVLLAVPSAYALSRYSFKLKSTVDVFLELPMIVSPAALGAILLIFFHPRLDY